MLHLSVKKVADLLHHSDSIAALYRVLAELDEVIKKLIDIGHVKVARYCQVSGHPVIFPQERVTVRIAVLAISAVPQVAEQQLTHEWNVLLVPFCLGLVII